MNVKPHVKLKRPVSANFDIQYRRSLMSTPRSRHASKFIERR